MKCTTGKFTSFLLAENVRAVLLYGCESWRMTKGDEAKLDTFQHKCLRRLLKIYWPICMSNEEVRRRANSETISELGRKRRWTWIGHVLCMDNRCLPRVALTWAPEGKRKRGKPKETWRRRESHWVSTLGLRQDWRQQTGYLGGAWFPALFSIQREGTDDDDDIL